MLNSIADMKNLEVGPCKADIYRLIEIWKYSHEGVFRVVCVCWAGMTWDDHELEEIRPGT